MSEPDYNNPTQEMIDSIGGYSTDVEDYRTESLIRRMYDHLGLEVPSEDL